MSLVKRFFACVAFVGTAAALTCVLSAPSPAQQDTIVRPQVVIEDFRAVAQDASVIKQVSTRFTYPDVRMLDAYLRVEIKGAAGEKKLSAFITVSEDGRIFSKHKEKFKFASGRYEITIPELLDLKQVFGDHRMKLHCELALEGADGEVLRDSSFEVQGRPLPRVEILDYRWYPERTERSGSLGPGDTVEYEVAFTLADADDALVRLRVLGEMDEEDDFTVDPLADNQEYDAYWDEARGPRRDGTYLLTFRCTLPSYFYEPGARYHDFTLHVVFFAEDEVLQHLAIPGSLYDYEPWIEREVDEEVFRAIRVERSHRWRIAPLSRNRGPVTKETSDG
jgi:hypothetical protein